MAPTLYWASTSPPARAVVITARAIGLNLNFEVIKLVNKEHRKPEFLKLNPQHTVPVLVDDDGFVIVDSHAIITYLVSKYAKDDSLYPKDLKKRAIIDHKLHFESGILWARCSISILHPILLDGKKTVDQEAKDSVVETYGFLEAFLKDKPWMAGDTVTIADYSIIATVSSISIDLFVPIDSKKFPRLADWVKRCQDLSEYEGNREGLEDFKNLYKTLLA